jgi:hypothetical protein
MNIENTSSRETSTTVGNAATAETLAIAGTSGSNNIGKNTSTTQETTGTAGAPTTEGMPKQVETSVEEGF